MAPNKIKEIRLSLALTQEQFAHVVGVSFPTVNKWENGKSRPSQLATRRLKELALVIGNEKTDERVTILPEEIL